MKEDPDMRNGSSAASPLVASMLPAYGATETVTIDNDEPVFVTGDSVVSGDSSPHCRDVIFGFIFWVHAIVVIWLGCFVAPSGYENINFDFSAIEEALRKDEDITEEEISQIEEFAVGIKDYLAVYPLRILLYLVLPCCILAFLVAFFITAFIVKRFPKAIVYFSLVGSLLLTALIVIVSAISSGSLVVAATTGLILFAAVYYVSVAWRMVPFAAVNLKGALKGMSRNFGVYLVAFFFAELGFAWIVFWGFTLVGVAAAKNKECQSAHPNSNFDFTSDEYDDICDPSAALIIFFVLSLYWTSTVVMNAIQVTVAGVMATWCFDKREANNCCSSAVYSSLFRSLTYSFGSVCLGSLLQALVSTFRYILDGARAERDRDNSDCGGICLCILDCLARWLEDILEYFNQFAYVYVGIYGFSYLESGRRVVELFRARGWSTIVSDNLVGYVLTVITFTVGITTGFIAIALESGVSSRFVDENSEFESYLGLNRIGVFIFGFVIGTWVCSVMTKVVRGAVNTLIVCFADSPAVFELQHPALIEEIADSWTLVFHESSLHIRPMHRPVIA